MINRLSRFGAFALNGLLALLLLFAIVTALPPARAQTQYLPIPSGVAEAGQFLKATDGNNVQGSTSLSTLSLGSLTLGTDGTAVTQIRVYSASLTPAAVNTIVCAEQTFTVTGLTTADKVIVNPPAIANAVSPVAARVSAANTLALQFCNPTGGSATPAAGAYLIIAIRS
jgi:hypothetical protein